MKVKWVVFALCLCLPVVWSSPVANAYFQEIPGFRLVGETEHLQLYYNDDAPSILVRDIRNGFIWRTSVSEKDYDMSKVTDTWRANMSSLFDFTYTDIKKSSDRTTRVNSVLQKADIHVRQINNGVIVEYFFNSLNIGLSLEIWLEGDALNVRVPKAGLKELDMEELAATIADMPDLGQRLEFVQDRFGLNSDRLKKELEALLARRPQINEKSKFEYENSFLRDKINAFGLVDLKLLPFFGAATDADDGYLFYPDGCGALMFFNRPHPALTTGFQWSVYSQDDVDMEAISPTSSTRLKETKPSVALPVFGIKRGENAFLHVIDQGAHEATIHLSPPGDVVDLYRMSTQFTYRRLMEVTRPNMTTVKLMDRELLEADKSIKIIFLYGNEASYSGMAGAYRKYLTDSGGINSSIKAGDEIPLGLDLLTGMKEQRILFDKFIAMTTFGQAQEIIEQFKMNGVNYMMVNLLGWTKGGFGAYPVHLPPNRALGGTRGIRELAGYASREGVKLFLQDNFVDASASNRGFNKRNDVVYHKNGLVVTNRFSSHFLLNPVMALRNFVSGFLPQVKTYGVGGVTFERFGSLVFFDYNKNNPANRMQTVEHWQGFMAQSVKERGAAAARGVNSYVLKYSDWLLDLPYKDSGYFFTDEAVPFYQMVVHGLVPYTYAAGNLFHDRQQQKLKWVEYGYMPYYQLTYQSPEKLKYTGYSHLFNSLSSDWIQAASGVSNEFNQRFGHTWTQAMLEHKRFGEKLYRVAYSDGTMIYINYNEHAIMTEGKVVEALDYLVVDKGGGVR